MKSEPITYGRLVSHHNNEDEAFTRRQQALADGFTHKQTATHYLYENSDGDQRVVSFSPTYEPELIAQQIRKIHAEYERDAALFRARKEQERLAQQALAAAASDLKARKTARKAESHRQLLLRQAEGRLSTQDRRRLNNQCVDCGATNDSKLLRCTACREARNKPRRL